MRPADLRLALALCFILTAAVPAAGVISFRTDELEEELTGADNPQAITIADVDGVDAEDIIAAEPEDDSVAVFYNDGSGEFVIQSFETNGAGPVAVATGLFNTDNFIDIVAVNNVEGSVSILLNDEEGEGDFNSEDDPRRFAVSPNPIGVAVGDFDNDTEADLAVLSPDSIYLLKGAGDGTFSAFNPATVSTRGNDSFAIAAGLLNADSNLDLAVTNRNAGQVVIFLGNGDGTFTFNGFVNVGAAPTGIIIADPDNNSTNDLIVVDSEAIPFDEVRLLRNNGQAEFSAAESVVSGENPLAITALDVEPDNKVDIAVTTTMSDQISLLCQISGKCTELGGELEAGIWRAPVSGSVQGCTATGQVAIVSGNLNGDTMDDLVALAGDLTTLCVSLNVSTEGNQPTPTSISTVATPTPTGPTPTPTATRTFTNTPTATQVPTIGLSTCSSADAIAGVSLGRPVAVAVDDFDRDGVRDVAVADADGNRIVLLLTTIGTVNAQDPCAALSLDLGSVVSNVTAPENLVAGDLNRDGSVDLAVIGSQGLSIFFGNGSGGFTPSAANPIEAGSDPSDLVLTDFNRDSTPDILVSDAGSESVSIFLGTRQENQPFNGRCAMRVGRRTNRVVSTDLNADGRIDFAATGPQTRDVGVFLQAADATLSCNDIGASFLGQTPLSLPSEPADIVVGMFFQSDTVPDLAVTMRQAGGNGTVILFEGRAAGSGVTYVRGTATAIPTPKANGQSPNPSAIGTGDIERDGRPDIVVTDMQNSTLAEFRGQNGGGLGVGLDALHLDPEMAATGPVALQVVDLDRDGRDDVVVANAGNRTITYLLSALRAPTPTPTDTPVPTFTVPPPTGVGTATLTPTITPSPTRSRRPSPTSSPVPTQTQRGVVTLSNGGCELQRGSNESASMMLWAIGIAAFLIKRRLQGR